MRAESYVALELRGLSKAFGGVQALSDVSLSVRAGEVHGLLGENGSGKSTLIKVLAGFHAPDRGELRVRGESVGLPLQAGAFRALRMDFVHQDLGLIPSLSVVENLRLGELASTGRGWQDRLHISWRAERRRARETFRRYGIDLDPGATVLELRPVERALLAIVRAVEGVRAAVDGAPDGARAGFLVLDEPTVFLPRTGTEQLFGLVREIAAGGSSVLFVSHDLEEVMEITDRVTVLRDGEVAGTVDTHETDEASLVELIIGRRLAALESKPRDMRRGEVIASLQDVSGALLNGVSLQLHRGEILGVTGLVGSGFEEVPYVMFGAWPALRGRLHIAERSLDLRKLTPRQALDLGLALVPADRHRDAAVMSLSITDNLTLQTLDRHFEMLVLRRREMAKTTESLMRTFDVRPADPRPAYATLSGGNQQKALLGKWLGLSPELLLLHEPTQGVDVGAREQIFRLIREAAAGGMSVICASSDYEQLAAICDRVLVVGRGRLVSELAGSDITKERITEQCYSSINMSQNLEMTA